MTGMSGNAVDYFIDRHRFEQKVAAGEFIEHFLVHGNLYGTSVAEVEKWNESGKDLIVEVDVPGLTTPVLKNVPYRHILRPLYPLDDDWGYTVGEPQWFAARGG